MTQHQFAAVNAWSAAAAVRELLARGGQLPPVASPVPLDPDEHAVAVFSHHAGATFRYERYLRAEVTLPSMGPTVIVGPAPFVAGAAAMNAFLRTRALRRAQATAAWQWRAFPGLGVTLTTRRLWVHPYGSELLHFTFDSITGLELTNTSMTLQFPQVAPLRLTGAWAPWLAEVITHYRRPAVAGVPQLGWPTAAAG